MYGGKETLVWRYDYVDEETLGEWAKVTQPATSPLPPPLLVQQPQEEPEEKKDADQLH